MPAFTDQRHGRPATAHPFTYSLTEHQCLHRPAARLHELEASINASGMNLSKANFPQKGDPDYRSNPKDLEEFHSIYLCDGPQEDGVNRRFKVRKAHLRKDANCGPRVQERCMGWSPLFW